MKVIVEYCPEEDKIKVANAILEIVEEGSSRHNRAEFFENLHFYRDKPVLSEVHHIRLETRIIFLQGR